MTSPLRVVFFPKIIIKNIYIIYIYIFFLKGDLNTMNSFLFHKIYFHINVESDLNIINMFVACIWSVDHGR